MKDDRGIDQLPSGSYRIRLQHAGGALTGTAPSLVSARQVRDELKRQIIDGQLEPTKGATAAMLGPRFLGSRAGNRDADTDTSRWERHIATATWARKPVASVTRSDGVAWLKAIKAKRLTWEPTKGGRRSPKLSLQSRKHCLNLARRFFAWALEGELVAANPFSDLVVAREDGDEDGGYQDTWYLDAAEQARFLATWDDKNLDLDATDRAEKWLVQFAMGTGMREGEQWCLHLTDLHVDAEEPHVVVRFGSWDPVKRRYRSPKGRKGEKKSRIVPLFGRGLEAARAWLKELPTYAKKNPLGLVFPTERGALRSKPPRSWSKVIEAFGALPRIGRGPWWHLLRHTCASSLVSGWWGMRWALEDVQRVLGHTDVRTTQIYAHLSPSVLLETAGRAQEAYLGASENCHGVVTTPRPAARKGSQVAGIIGYARSDSNGRHSASKADALSS